MALRPLVSSLLRRLQTVGLSANIGRPGIIVVVPVVIIAPSLSTSSPKVGTAVSATAGTYTGSPTVTRQWFYGDTGVAISGATGLSYTPVSADVRHPLKYIETATNGGGRLARAAPTPIAVNAVTYQSSPVTYRGAVVTY